MLLTISTTHSPATDLGFLLAKHPQRFQSFKLAFGGAHVFYPEVGEERCTAALLLDIDPIALTRKLQIPEAACAYINDRPYVASSFLSVAIARVFGSGLNGQSRDRQELADTPIPLEASVSALPARSDESIRTLFEPLGYQVETESIALDPERPDWGQSRYWNVRLGATCRLADLLNHLYVLVPVFDDSKHYWVGDEEVEKLLRRGDGWLGDHPEKDRIVRLYLERRGALERAALAELRDTPNTEVDSRGQTEEGTLERPIQLHQARHERVADIVRTSGARTVIDLGCGSGQLLRRLAEIEGLERVVGVDVSSRALEVAERRLGDRPAELMQGALTYQDDRFSGFDVACLVEVVEHMEPPRLPALARSIFGFAKPGMVVVTTPNAEFNVRFEALAAGQMRHSDHRFEWTRAEFADWVTAVCETHGYYADVHPLGEADPEVGAPSQLAVFVRGERP